MTEEHFYDHFHQDSPTGIGNRITQVFSKKIFKYVKIEPHHSILEIGPGRGVFADICLEKGIEYFAVEPNQQMAASLEKRGANVTRAMVPPLPDLANCLVRSVMSCSGLTGLFGENQHLS